MVQNELQLQGGTSDSAELKHFRNLYVRRFNNVRYIYLYSVKQDIIIQQK